MIKMDELTLAQAEQLHERLWGELAETGGGDKSVCQVWAECDRVASRSCFACEIAEQQSIECADCPIEWPGGAGCYKVLDGPIEIYEQWANADDPEVRKVLAAQIRDLPWRQEEPK